MTASSHPGVDEPRPYTQFVEARPRPAFVGARLISLSWVQTLVRAHAGWPAMLNSIGSRAHSMKVLSRRDDPYDLSALAGTRRTATNFARKSSSSTSRTSAGIRSTILSSGGSGFVSTGSSDSAFGTASTTSPRSRASARKEDSAISSAVSKAGSSGVANVAGDTGTEVAKPIGAPASTAGRSPLMGAVAGCRGSGSANVSGGTSAVSRASSRSIRAFFLSRRPGPRLRLHRPAKPIP